jgi:hypothetical protein
MKRRFGKKQEPVTTRWQLQYARQQDNESLEDFAHKVYVLALDGYGKCEEKDSHDGLPVPSNVDIFGCCGLLEWPLDESEDELPDCCPSLESVEDVE